MLLMKKAAIFDLDGTLIPGVSSESCFFRFLLKKGEIPIFNSLRYFLEAVKNTGNYERMVLRNKTYLKGIRKDRLSKLAEECFLPKIQPANAQ